MPYGFPSGAQLRDQLLHEGFDAGLVLAATGVAVADFEEFRRAFAVSHTPSIDLFLERRRGFEVVGKACIAAELLRCEQRHRQRIASGMAENCPGAWYRYLLHTIMALHTPEELPKNNLTIITFNYDRSLEYFVAQYLAAGFGITHADAVELVNRFPIHHVHGYLGGKIEVITGPSSYGANLTPELVKTAYPSIQIVHNAGEKSEPFARAREAIAGAEVVVFLGFGYNRTNLDRLHVAELCTLAFRERMGGPMRERQAATILGTAFGLTESEKISDIRRWLKPNAITLSTTSDELLRGHREIFHS